MSFMLLRLCNASGTSHVLFMMMCAKRGVEYLTQCATL
jgi:hypothetical protein